MSFIIVTDDRLMSGARDYAIYRADAGPLGGGGWDTLIVTSRQLADQFNFGADHSPLGIRRFVDYMIKNQTTPPPFLFFIRKRISKLTFSQMMRLRNKNMVPCYGAFGSDNMITYGIGRLRV